MERQELMITLPSEEKRLRRQFWIGLLLSMPVLFYSPPFQEWLPFSLPAFMVRSWIAPLFALLVFSYGGLPFLRLAAKELHSSHWGIMAFLSLLVIGAISASLAFLILAFLVSAPVGGSLWIGVVLMDGLLLGQWVGGRRLRQVTTPLQRIISLLPETVERITQKDQRETVPVGELKRGDLVLMRLESRTLPAQSHRLKKTEMASHKGHDYGAMVADFGRRFRTPLILVALTLMAVTMAYLLSEREAVNVLNFEALGLGATIAIFAGASLVIGVAGTYLTRSADLFADLTGIGEALVGAVLLGAVTSLAGVVTSLTAAAEGHPVLSVSNAIGGIAAQTAFLAVADLFYRGANLEHAAASLQNLMQSVILISLLMVLLAVITTPQVTVFGVHPASPVIIVAYLAAVKLVSRASKMPMWAPRKTAQTVLDEPDEKGIQHTSLAKVSVSLLVNGIAVAIAGYLVAQSGIALSAKTGLSETFVGSLFTAVATSLPELVVSVSAVKQGALTLAVGNIVGGNSFEVLVVAAADFVYLDGSLLHATTESQTFIIALTALLMGVLLLGLLYRQRQGIAGIGWESFLILLLFLGGYGVLYLMG